MNENEKRKKKSSVHSQTSNQINTYMCERIHTFSEVWDRSVALQCIEPRYFLLILTRIAPKQCDRCYHRCCCCCFRLLQFKCILSYFYCVVVVGVHTIRSQLFALCAVHNHRMRVIRTKNKLFALFNTDVRIGVGIRDCLHYLELNYTQFDFYHLRFHFDWFLLLGLIVGGGFSTTITWCWLESRGKNYNWNSSSEWTCDVIVAIVTSAAVASARHCQHWEIAMIIVIIIIIIIIGDRFLLTQLAVQQQNQMNHVDLMCTAHPINTKRFRNRSVSFGKLQDNDESTRF